MFKTTKAKVIFVAVFSIICITITAMLIIYQKIDINEKSEDVAEEISKENNEKDVPGIDLKGKYNQNDLIIEEKSVSLAKAEIRYLQISGLKNKNIENEINKEIEHTALNYYKEKIKNLNEVVNVQVSMWQAANFANTISFELSYYAKIDNEEDDFYQGRKCLNYDLNTGEKIKIEKLFSSDAPMENILRNAAYYSLIQEHTEENLAGDFTVSDYGNIEDNIVEIIFAYKNGKITDFYYTPRYINFCYNDHLISIDMKDYAEYIAIYNRYLSEQSLYENDNIGIKNLYTLTIRYNDIYYYQNYQNENNYFIDISINLQSADTDEFAKNLIDNKILDIEKEIENVKQKASQNPNEFYILNYYMSVYTGENNDFKQIVTNYNECGNAYEITVHDFEENIEPIIIEYNRITEFAEVPDYVYNFTEMLDLEPYTLIEYYNPETGEKIVL